MTAAPKASAVSQPVNAAGIGSTPWLERRVLEILDGGPSSCTAIGEALWRNGSTRCPRQAFARPAGKLLHAMKRRGLVENKPTRTGRKLRWLWHRSNGRAEMPRPKGGQ